MIKIISLMIVLACITSCASTSLKHINEAKFDELRANTKIVHPADTYRIIGHTKIRIYIEHHSLITGKTIIYWIKIIEISPKWGDGFIFKAL